MLISCLRIVVKQPLGHHQVASNVLGIRTAQGAQLVPGTSLQICGLDVVRDAGFGNALTLRRATSTIIPSVPRRLPLRVVAEAPRPPAAAVRPSVTGAPITTPFTARVITHPVLVVRAAFVMSRALGTLLRIERTAVSPGAVATARPVIILFEALASTEAMTFAFPTTPT